jgi:hypothetical protein
MLVVTFIGRNLIHVVFLDCLYIGGFMQYGGLIHNLKII